jgi:hypothetical protein
MGPLACGGDPMMRKRWLFENAEDVRAMQRRVGAISVAADAQGDLARIESLANAAVTALQALHAELLKQHARAE